MNHDEKPIVWIAGQDGNAHAVIATVSQALKEKRQREKAREFTRAALACESYEELLHTTTQYVEWR